MAKKSVDLKELRKLLSAYKLLYVEDNLGLREKANTLFQKLFSKVYVASNGQEGLELFIKHKPEFVITDIKMPQMNGIEMATKIKALNPKTKIIATSAYDDKEYLLDSIELKIDSYLMKPIQVDKLTLVLYKIAKDKQKEDKREVFCNYLHSIFNHQYSLILMLKQDRVVLANDQMLNFFDAKTIEEFREKFKNFNQMLAPHETFLYAQNQSDDCLKRVKKDIDRPYNVKIFDKDGSPCHFILKLTQAGYEDYYILSLINITELNLLALYDKNSLEYDNTLKDKKSIYNLLCAARDAGEAVKLYNYYKGLTVCNKAVLEEVGENSTILKTSVMQLKAARFEKKVILNCELFPYDIQADTIVNIDFHTQTIEIGKCHMLKTTPSQRKYLVLEPKSNHEVTISYKNQKFNTQAHIINISKESARVHLDNLPDGIKETDEIVLHMVFKSVTKPHIINTSAKVYKIIPVEKGFELICIFILEHSDHKVLIDYLASRQMELVKEFKGLKI